jgi:hypothetical protein
MRPRLGLAVAGALAALAVLAPLARAAYDPLASGATKLTLDRSFLALLKQNGVRLSATAPAKLTGGSVSFPVTGGKFDPAAGRGKVEHEGALVFKAGNRSVPVKALQLKTTQRRSPFSAKVGGSQLKLATVRALTVARAGFGERIAVARLALSAKLATRLGKKLRLEGVFREGLPLGSARTMVQPETVTVLGRNRATLAFAPDFAAKLASLFVAVNPIFPAEHPAAGFTLPIFGGTIAPDGSRGEIVTSGALEFLQLGGGQVFWAEMRFDPATLALSSPPLADPKARTVGFAGAALALDAATAATFNETFAKPKGKDGVFVAGEALATLSFVAQGQ